jgi:hypothetical protein
LNSASPTEAQQALYSLPQNDYNVITSGTNGYTAGAGYNLVTGLGTPVANLVVSDLVAYQSGTFVASGPTVGALSNANLESTGAAGSGTTNVFAVFDSLIGTSNGLGLGQSTVANSAMTTTLAPTPAVASQAPSAGFLAQGGHGLVLGTMTVTVANPGLFGVMPNSANEVTVIPVTTGLALHQPAVSMARPRVNTTATQSKVFAGPSRIEPSSALSVIPTTHDVGRLTDSDSVLDDLARDFVLARGQFRRGERRASAPCLREPSLTGHSLIAQVRSLTGQGVTLNVQGADAPRSPFTARLAAILLAVGYWGHGGRIGTSRKRGAGSPAAKRASLKGKIQS